MSNTDEITALFPTCLEKQHQIKMLFDNCISPEQKYYKIIEIGNELPSLSSDYHIEENLVLGCQSTLYLKSSCENNQISFQVFCEALISRGLAALLIGCYDGESPEAILKCPPHFLEELDIYASLSPSRSNGLHSLYLRMKQDAIKVIIQNQSKSKDINHEYS